MKQLVIMMIVYNQEEEVKVSLNSIRAYADVDDLSVIVVDNSSSDGLRSWAEGQEDFTYVYMDEGKLPFGVAANKVMEALEIKGDVLITNGGFLLTPHCLSRMQESLHAEENIGAVGARSYYFIVHNNYQNLDSMGLYEEMLEKAEVCEKTDDKRVMALAPEAILFKAETLEQIGRFDESVNSQANVMRDYCVRLILKDWKLMVCNSAFLYNIENLDSVNEWPNELDNRILEQKWGIHYFACADNANIVNFIDEDKYAEISVLEVGCDCGGTLLEIKNRYPRAHVYGAEINEHSAAVAAHFATVCVNNIEQCNLDYSPETFDYIIFADVLEHLRNPLEVVKYVKGLLKKGGHLICSIPNVCHIHIWNQLLKGNFTYTEMGLLDKTHIHLFTYNEIVRMFEEAGYHDLAVACTVDEIDQEEQELIHKLLAMGPELEEHMLTTFQYLVKVRK